MDNFEKYINENRTELDRMEDVPMEAMWAKIAPENSSILNSEQRKVKVLRNWVFGLAASIVLLIGFGITLWPKDQNPIDDGFEKFENPIAQLSPEMAETEENFKLLILIKNN